MNECLMREPWTNNVMVRAHEGKKGRCTGKLNSYGKADGLKERKYPIKAVVVGDESSSGQGANQYCSSSGAIVV